MERLVQVKEQAKEEAAQLLNMENEVELNRVGDKAPGKVKSKFHTNPGGRNQPYVRGGGGTGGECGHCARQHGKEVKCPATEWPSLTSRSSAWGPRTSPMLPCNQRWQSVQPRRTTKMTAGAATA